MKAVRPKVFLIGKTYVEAPAVREWLDDIGADKYRIENGTTSGEQLTQLAGKRCYMSFQPGINRNIERVRTDMVEFIDNILKVGHGSVLEHVVYNFAIEHVSRVFTGEMNRHRAGMAISEGSMRFIRFDDIPWVQTEILRLENYEGDELAALREKIRMTIALFNNAFEQDERNYRMFETIWEDELSSTSTFKKKKTLTSLGRRIIGMGVATGGVWSGNLRALRHIFTMRCDAAAEEEILEVASLMLVAMQQAEPIIFGDFHVVDGYWQPAYRKV